MEKRIGIIMPGYKHPCRYCGKLVSSDDNSCTFCGKVNPTGSDKCPKCRHPIKEGQLTCSDCGQNLQIKCPHCGETTFFTDYCNNCGQRLTVICTKCGEEQPPISKKCLKCDKPL
jgi:RNA polymerase subunit RPABC4/transcription elongation factor Spt4